MRAAPPSRPYLYEPGRLYDEAFVSRGEPREHYADVITELQTRDMAALREAVQSDVTDRGCSFVVEGGTAAFLVDPVPRILSAEEWAPLAAGLEQRAEALNAFVADVYGERRCVTEGVVPERVVLSADHFEPDAAEHPRDLTVLVAGLDIIRDDGGRFLALEDNVRTPSGLAYAIAARHAVAREVPPTQPVEDFEAHALAALRRGLGDGHVVLLTDGSANAAWWEHRYLGSRLGIPVVTPRECRIRGDRLLAAGRTVDVVYRRTDEDRMRDETGALTLVGALLDGPLRAGTLEVYNGFGTGVADDKLVHAYIEDLVRFYSGEPAKLPSVKTYDVGNDACLTEVLDRIDELVVKPRNGYGGEGVVIGPHASAATLAAMRDELQMHPRRYIAQETVHFSRHPTVMEDGSIAPRHVDLRPYVVHDGERAEALPGGLTRVALQEGTLVVNSSQDGGGKDTWVLSP